MKNILLKTTIFLLILMVCGAVQAQTTNELINQEVEKYFKKLKGTSSEQLIRAVTRGNKVVQLASIKALGESKSTKATNILLSVMCYVWNPAIYEKHFNEGKKVEGLTLIFDDDIRAEAAMSLAKIDNKNMVPYIGNTINADRNSKVRQYCAKALGMLRSRIGISYLEKAINYELNLEKPNIDNLVVLECARALGDIGHKDGFFALIEVTQNNKLKYETRKEALKSLEKVKWE
ncbi:MAG: hypothetical protein KKH98_13700 [Spirochaetes bacterium]|nr:hypothetical protein [Spirochaetota bacterium]